MGFRDRYAGDQLQDGGLEERLEDLRLGTFKQFRSHFYKILPGAVVTLDHNLGDVPLSVDVAKSDTADGGNPSDGNSLVTVTKTNRQISVTNDGADALYFQARAF